MRNYRYTVLDVPRSNPAMLDALEAAMEIFVVTNQELASVRGASRVADALSRRYTREKVSLVVSRFDKGCDIGTDDIEQVVQASVRVTVPSDYHAALQALNEGRPFVLDSHSKLASSVLAFASQLSGDSLPITTASAAKAGTRWGKLAALRWLTTS